MTKSKSKFSWIGWGRRLAVGAAVVFLAYMILREKFPDIAFPVHRGTSPQQTPRPVDVVDINFNQPGDLKGWREYSYGKKATYEIEKAPDGQMALHGQSRDAYSSIFKLINVPLDSQPVLAWQWRALKFPSAKKSDRLDAKNENDYAIRICAIFARNNPLVTDIIQYIWDDRFPVGTYAPSPNRKNVRMLVVQNGPPESTEEWSTHKRDLLKDYKMLFGKMRFHDLKSIAITTSSDETHTESEAYVKRVWVESAHPDKIKKHKHWFRKKITGLWQGLRSRVFVNPLRLFRKKQSSDIVTVEPVSATSENEGGLAGKENGSVGFLT